MPPAFLVNQFWHIFDHMSKVTAKHENLKQPYLRILHGCTLAKITLKQTTDQSVKQKIKTGYTLLYFTVCLTALCVNSFILEEHFKSRRGLPMSQNLVSKKKTGEQYLDRFGEIQNYAKEQFYHYYRPNFGVFFFL